MKLNSLISVFVFLIVSIGCEKKSPIISFEKATIDIGTVMIKEDSSVIFHIENTGNAVLKIERVSVDCSCITPKKYPKTIQPGKTAILEIHHKAKNFGYFEQIAEVYSNAENNSIALLVIKGVVQAPNR